MSMLQFIQTENSMERIILKTLNARYEWIQSNLDGFSWTKDNYAMDCIGPLKTMAGQHNTYGWNGILTWCTNNKVEINLMKQN